MRAAVKWSKRKAIVLESDDWGGVTRTATPNAEACRQAEPLWAVSRGRYDTWRKGSLETVEHMQRLFEVLQAFRGGDGRPVVFSPMVLVGNPDFDAIEANGFTAYVDIGIDQGWPAPWRGEGTIEKAREGMKLGIWRPEYHGRTHHYSGQRWVDVLRGREDDTLLGFFALRMFGISECKVGIEYDDMDEAAQYEWTKVGIERFERCFGRRPDCAINSDATEVTERVWQRFGVKVRLNAQNKGRTMGETNPDTGMFYITRNVMLEPQGQPDDQTNRGCSGAYAKTLEVWAANQPACVSIHRKNFTSLDPEEDATSWSQFEQYLSSIQTNHPDAAYLCDWEAAQLWQTGTSAARYGDDLICRNWTDKRHELAAAVPKGMDVEDVADLASQKHVRFDRGDHGAVRIACEDGNYMVKLGPK